MWARVRVELSTAFWLKWWYLDHNSVIFVEYWNPFVAQPQCWFSPLHIKLTSALYSCSLSGGDNYWLLSHSSSQLKPKSECREHVYLLFYYQRLTQFNCGNYNSVTFARLTLEQAISDELRAALLQGCSLPHAAPFHCFSFRLILTAQFRCVEGQSGEE